MSSMILDELSAENCGHPAQEKPTEVRKPQRNEHERGRSFTPEEKLAVLRRHFLEGETISSVCDQMGLNPATFHQWRKTLFYNGASAFQRRARAKRFSPASVPGAVPRTFTASNLMIDFDAKRVLVRGEYVRLTPTEWDLLDCLVSCGERPMNNLELLQRVWGPGCHEAQYVRVAISQLRKKIEPDPQHPVYIVTDPWFGYRFAGAVGTPSS